MTAAEVLRSARALIPDEAHWHRYGYGDQGRKCVCMWGAINVAVGGWENVKMAPPGSARRAAGAAVEMLRRAAGIGYLPAFNDAPGRTLAEVHAAFDAAIAACETDGGAPGHA